MLAYMTADVGAHHNRAWALGFDVAHSDADVNQLLNTGVQSVGLATAGGKAEKVIALQHTRPLFDALGVCRLQSVEIGFENHYYEEAFALITGRHLSWAEMLYL